MAEAAAPVDYVYGNDDTEYWVRIHGGVMAVTWTFLVPLGIIFARYKTFIKGTFLNIKVWFHVHRLVQLLAIAGCVSSFTIAMIQLGIPDGIVGQVHYYIGLIVMGLTSLQALTPLLKPDHPHPQRKLWDIIHHNIGRFDTLLAWTNLGIGVYCFNTQSDEPWLVWILPMSLSVLFFLGVVLVFELLKRRTVIFT